MRINVPFGLHAYQDRSLPVNAQKLINFFIEAQPQDSKSPVVLNNTPGSTLWVTVGGGPIHGMDILKNILYVVSGTELYSVTSTGTSTLLGTIVGNVRVHMAHNDQQVCIVNGIKGYIYDTSTATLSEITDSSFYLTNRVVYLQTRFIFPRSGTQQIFCSNADDGTTFDGTFYAPTITDPDDVVSMLADHAEIWVFGKKGNEIWTYNRNEADFPFSRLDGSYVEKGCYAAQSPAKLDNTFYWLGDDLIVYRADGYKPTRISTHAIEHKIKSYSNPENAYSNTFSIQGHQFYELTFPSQATWRYDASTGLWHQAQYGNSGQYLASCHAQLKGDNIIGDYRNGNLYKLSMDVFDDNSATIYRTASTPHIHSGRLRAAMDMLELDIASGEGLTTGQGSDPQMMMKYSDDGGRTFSSERWANMGRIGEYTRRVRYYNLGMFYQRMFEIQISDPIKSVIIDAFVNVDVEDTYD